MNNLLGAKCLQDTFFACILQNTEQYCKLLTYLYGQSHSVQFIHTETIEIWDIFTAVCHCYVTRLPTAKLCCFGWILHHQDVRYKHILWILFTLQQHYFVNNKNYLDRKWDEKSIKNFNQLSKCVKTLFIFSQSGTLHNTLPKLKIDQKRGKTRAEKKLHVPD